MCFMLVATGCKKEEELIATFLPGVEGYIVPKYENYLTEVETQEDATYPSIAFEGTLKEFFYDEYVICYVVETKQGDWMVTLGIQESIQDYLYLLRAQEHFEEGARVYVYASYITYSPIFEMPACSLYSFLPETDNNQIYFADTETSLNWQFFNFSETFQPEIKRELTRATQAGTEIYFVKATAENDYTILIVFPDEMPKEEMLYYMLNMTYRIMEIAPSDAKSVSIIYTTQEEKIRQGFAILYDNGDGMQFIPLGGTDHGIWFYNAEYQEIYDSTIGAIIEEWGLI